MGASLEIILMLIIAPQAVDESTEHTAKTGMRSTGLESYLGLKVHTVETTPEPYFQTT